MVCRVWFAMSTKLALLLIAVIVVILVSESSAGPVSWAACQTACNVGYVTCCVIAGGIAGTFTLVGAPAALAACSTVQGSCMAACTPLLLAPTP
ncbi:unnamed protein product [Medioppia subpectinata]|uniref:Uncharacterized protein n=1 Tax=Medioppia subpectinata TaxID=1979941 RepID=A0A7R9KIQ2_9ACAR|nr:unnamed protein product [Medioppia subpectinata]CAG2103135.1 unnamed protein product [Medioppia subpectinata]